MAPGALFARKRPLSPLRDDKAPFAIALLLGAFGWHITQITNEVKAARSVAYEVDESPATDIQRIHLQNISSDIYLRDLNFELNCPDAAPCIDPESVSVKAVQPVVIRQNITADPVDTVIKTYLPASSSLWIESRRVKGARFPVFHYTPTPEQESGISLLKSTSWRVFLVRYYLEIILLSFAGIIAILAFVSYMLFMSARGPKPEAGLEPENPDNVVP